MFRLAFHRLCAAVLFTVACSAQASLPSVTMDFSQRSGVVGASDSIDVWITMTVPLDGTPLAFNQGAGAPFGFNAADLPRQGQYYDAASNRFVDSDFATYRTVQTNGFFGCAGTLTVCGSSYYDFSFNFFGSPGKPSFYGQTSFDLQPGQSYSYLFGTFNPHGGPVPDGTYNFYDAGATLTFGGLDAAGHSLYAYSTIGYTCQTGVALSDCQFTRTVVSVPEPQTYALIGVGLLLVAGVARRRR